LVPGAPKPPGQRRRRNLGQSKWRQLPADGAGPQAPPLPRKRPAWLKATREWWARAWASPMAVMWLDSDVDAMYRLALLRDAVWREPKLASLHGQVTALEDRLGLTPGSRRRLQWEITKAEQDADPEQPDGPPASAKVRTLRAV
jgi:hypothetical protein